MGNTYDTDVGLHSGAKIIKCKKCGEKWQVSVMADVGSYVCPKCSNQWWGATKVKTRKKRKKEVQIK